MNKIAVSVDGYTFEIEVQLDQCLDNTLDVRVDGQALRVTTPKANRDPEALGWVAVDNRTYDIVLDRELKTIKSFGGQHRLALRHLSTAQTARPVNGNGQVKAPLPGRITAVLVRAGDPVEAGQPLLLLDALGMESEIRAHRPGCVSALHVEPGCDVGLHDLLAEII